MNHYKTRCAILSDFLFGELERSWNVLCATLWLPFGRRSLSLTVAFCCPRLIRSGGGGDEDGLRLGLYWNGEGGSTQSVCSGAAEAGVKGVSGRLCVAVSPLPECGIAKCSGTECERR